MYSVEDPKTLGERVASFLRLRHRSKTADTVAALTGCSRAQVCKWLELSSAPSLPAMIQLTHAYGPAFLAAVMGDRAPEWLGDAHRAERRRELEAQQAQVEHELRALAAR